MNYFIFYVGGIGARRYLGGTNYVGVWSNNQTEANEKVRRSFATGTQIIPTTRNQVQGEIGYLY